MQKFDIHPPHPSSRIGEVNATKYYYNRNAQAYFDSTLRVDMSALYNRFLKYVEPGGRILDAGSGSGRDTLALLQHGYKVDAFDASPALCKLSTQLTGVEAQVLRFQEFDCAPRYDGIWACASLLHVPEGELENAISRLIGALKPGGALYVSFKHGAEERISRDGRFFLDLNKESLQQLFRHFPSMSLEEVWLSSGEGTHQGRDEWLNAIALKAHKKGDL